MIIDSIKTVAMMPPKDDLLKVIDKFVNRIPEKSILVVSSKVVSIWQGRCVPVEKFPKKDDLIKLESEKYIPRNHSYRNMVMHTIKNGNLICTAGIDTSNANGFYILHPDFSKSPAKKIQKYLKNKFKLKELGVIISDSRSIPLRRGTVGFALDYFGFHPLNDYRKSEDIFKGKIGSTISNLADALAAGANLVMGEGGEQTPLALMTDVPKVNFSEKFQKGKYMSLKVNPKEDIYGLFINSNLWKKGGGGFKFKK